MLAAFVLGFFRVLLHNTVDLRIHTLTIRAKAADMQSTSKILVCIVDLCFEGKEWKSMQENIVMLAKRRGQLKAVCDLVWSC